MDRRTLAILVNLFVCPGAGLWMVGRKGLGLAYIFSILTLVLGLVVHFQLKIIERFKQFNYLASSSMIDHTVELSSHVITYNASLYKTGLILAVLIWIISTVHTYYLAKDS